MNSRINPYVGPRSFRRDEMLFGRDQVTRTLTHLVVAERIVLLYSPSGAGKTSLIQAALVPRLEHQEFCVLSGKELIRANTKYDGEGSHDINRYLLSTLLSLEEGVSKDERLSVEQLSLLTLKQYLKQRIRKENAGPTPILIFDQFEEVLTEDATDTKAKVTFFDQLGEALEDQGLWALFAMREEYLAGLDPFRELIPTRFNSTFRLELLGVEDAIEAMREPARKANTNFLNKAAEKLASDLCRVKVQQMSGTVEDELGEFVEPVHLQVVCHRLWEGLASDDFEIGLDDIHALGNVDTALSDYYSNSVRRISADKGIKERQIRKWIDEHLLTKQGLRSQVLRGGHESEGLDNNVVDALKGVHLIREDQRGGRKWLELAHDRLVTPVRQSNEQWHKGNLNFLSQCAELWGKENKAQSLLLQGEELARAQKEYDNFTEDFSGIEQDFLAASRAADENLRRKAKLISGIKLLALLLIIVTIVMGKMNAELKETQAKLLRVVDYTIAQWLAARARETEGNDEFGVRMLLAVEANNRTSDGDIRASLMVPLSSEKHLVTSVAGQRTFIRSIAQRKDGKAMASAGLSENKNLIELWNGISGRRSHLPLIGHEGWITSLAFSPMGKRLASASADGTVIVWDAEKGTKEIGPIAAGKSVVSSITFLGDDDQIAYSKLDKSVTLQNLKSGEKQYCDKLGGEVYSLSYSSRGILASGGADEQIVLWDVTGSKKCTRLAVLIGHSSPVYSVVFSPDGRLLASGGSNGEILIWNVETGKLIKHGPASSSEAIFSMTFDVDGESLITASGENFIRIWNVESIELLNKLSTSRPIYAISGIAENNTFWSGDETGTLALWNATAKHPFGEGLLGYFRSVAIGSSIAALTSSRNTTTINEIPPSRFSNNPSKLLGTIQSENVVAATAVSHDGQRLAVATESPSVEIWNLADLSRPEYTVQNTSKLTEIFFTADNGLLYVRSDGAIVYRKSGTSGEEVELDNSKGTNPIMALSGDGKVVALYTDKKGIGNLTVRSIPNNAVLLTKEVPEIRHMTLTDSGDTVAYYLEHTRSLMLQQIQSKLDPFDLNISDQVHSLAFSPNGSKMLAIGTTDERVILWSLDDRLRPARLPGSLSTTSSSHAKVKQLQFMPDGARLMAVSTNGRTVIWDVDFKSWQTIACERAVKNPNNIEEAQRLIAESEHKVGAEVRSNLICPESLLEESYNAWLEGDQARVAKSLSEARYQTLTAKDSLAASVPFTSNVCRHSLIYEGNAKDALPVCKKAEERAPHREKNWHRDNIGIALAMLGNLKEAKDEFVAYLEWSDKYASAYVKDSPFHKTYVSRGEKRKDWIQKLGNGVNPFDKQTIEGLQRE